MEYPSPDRQHYDDVRSRQVELTDARGTMSVLVYEPADEAAHPAVVIGAEGGGINTFIRCIAATLAHVGLVAVVPDYYRGVTMTDPDDYSDIPGMMRMIDSLDFRRAAHDFLRTIAFTREMANVNGKVAAWGYCTGGTVAMFGTCLDRDLDAAALFYPSQPTFDVIDATHPAHVIDLVWNIGCPVMFLCGDRDQVMSAERLAGLRERLSQWDIDHQIVVYPGAGHAFSSPGFELYDARTSEAAWRDALGFVAGRLGLDPA